MLGGVPDLLDRIRRELDDRVAQLRPAAEELARLQLALEALDRLSATPAAARPAAPARRAARAAPRRRRGARPRAAPGQTQQRVIDQLRSGPGTSSTAVAQALGISANAAAATISRLVKQGRVTRLKTGGYAAADPPAPQEPGTRAADPPPDPPTGES
jgi:hypothetical protein